VAVTRSPVVDIDGFVAATLLPLTDEQREVAEVLLPRFQAEAETLMRRPCVVAVTEEVVDEVLGTDMVVPTRHRPVVSLDATDPDDFPLSIVSGLLRYTNGSIPPVPFSATVDYHARLPGEQLAAVVGVIYDRTKRALVKEIDQAQGTDSIEEEGYNASYIDEGFTEAELEVLGRLRKRVMR
jgi:hypothetical protein